MSININSASDNKGCNETVLTSIASPPAECVKYCFSRGRATQSAA